MSQLISTHCGWGCTAVATAQLQLMKATLPWEHVERCEGNACHLPFIWIQLHFYSSQPNIRSLPLAVFSISNDRKRNLTRLCP